MMIFKTKHSFRTLAQFMAFFLILMGVSSAIHGQAVEMSQYWSAPLHVNPALAGISYGPRVSANYRNQWPGLGNGFNGGFVTYMVGRRWLYP
jgi:hypothetical protein